MINHLNDKYQQGRKLETDVTGEAIIWANGPQDAHDLVRDFGTDAAMKMDFLSDVTAYDNVDGEDGDKRFVLVYQLYSTTLKGRVRIKTLLAETEDALTITDLFLGANWLEREVYDMFGIKFKGHPNLRRIMMDERFTGFPLRKEYNMKEREPFNDSTPIHLGANPLPADAANK